MFCTECGAKNEDSAKFCVDCGVKLGNSNVRIKIPTPSETDSGMNKKVIRKPRKKINVIPIIILLILAVAVVTFPRLILSGQSEKKLIKEFIKAEMTVDGEKVIEILPDEIVEAAETQGGMTKNEFIKAVQEQLNSAMNTVVNTYGEEWKYSYEIKSIKKASQEDIEEWKNTYKDGFEMDVDISEGKICEVEINFNGNEIRNTSNIELNLVKIRGKWYIDFASLAALV
ncbi:zinc ribbon domain-containing protein [uncultured Eubacterium sp.]|uniref:zinc ribbon domain-containing protein n=1 Tax=uncultured Eubacterium sp. TaxID=165185 RepID=UPI0025F60B79|nr:zinc ribbon domain-containing protein [uncultured Eubacterium sp.]